jgi:hypothetical protein
MFRQITISIAVNLPAQLKLGPLCAKTTDQVVTMTRHPKVLGTIALAKVKQYPISAPCAEIASDKSALRCRRKRHDAQSSRQSIGHRTSEKAESIQKDPDATIRSASGMLCGSRYPPTPGPASRASGAKAGSSRSSTARTPASARTGSLLREREHST